MDLYFDAGLAQSTTRTYAAGITKYLTLCRELRITPTPTSEQLLCRFVSSLAESNTSHNTIKVYLAAVRQLHVQRGLRMPSGDHMPRLAQVLRGIKIRTASEGGQGSRQPRLPITPETLRQIKATWEKDHINNDKVMLWAAFTLCFFSFMRSGELCCTSSGTFDQSRDLTPHDISVDDARNPQTMKVHLKYSKTDPFKEGTDIFLARTNDELCPVAAMLSWLVLRGKEDGPLFQFQSGVPLTRSCFVSCLKGALTSANIDPSGFSGHGFRIGAATTAAKVGLPDSTIKQLGRWKSATYQRYIRPSSSHLAKLASSIAVAERAGDASTTEHPHLVT